MKLDINVHISTALPTNTISDTHTTYEHVENIRTGKRRVGSVVMRFRDGGEEEEEEVVEYEQGMDSPRARRVWPQCGQLSTSQEKK